MKVVLRKVLGKASLTYGEMYTVLCDYEVTLNSRPLTYSSEQPSDLELLTPVMFLHDLRQSEMPDLGIISKLDIKCRDQLKQENIEHSRNRYRKEYLEQLLFHSKKIGKLAIGDVELLEDDVRKRIDWPLARIEKLIAGRDGSVRVVYLTTKNGTFKRPIQRVYPLELSYYSEN